MELTRIVNRFVCVSIVMLFVACGKNDMEHTVEYYSASFVEIIPGESSVEEEYINGFPSSIKYDRIEVGDVKPRVCGVESTSIKGTYLLAIIDASAELSINKTITKTEILQKVKKYKYTFEPCTQDFIEITSNAIIVNGEVYLELENYSFVREEAYGEKYSDTSTNVEVYNGSFSYQRSEDIATMTNEDYAFEMEYRGSECYLTETYPEYKSLGVLKKT